MSDRPESPGLLHPHSRLERWPTRNGGPWGLGAQAALSLLIVGVPYAELALVIATPSGQCGGGPLVFPVPLSFVVDVLLLVPTYLACRRATQWLGRYATPPRQWRGHLAALGRGLSVLGFAGAIGWCVFVAWFGVMLACGLTWLGG